MVCVSAITNNFLFFGIDAHHASAIVGIQNHICIIRFWKGKSKIDTPLGRRHFGRNPVIKSNLIIMWLSHFICVIKAQRPVVLVYHQFPGNRHQRKSRVIVCPRTTLMRLPESTYRILKMLVNPSITIDPRLRGPEIHTPRHC